MINVSVILPVYNAEKTLERCLEAFINQTYSDFEAICVDDGSKDNSWQILEKYAQKDSRIKIYSQENHGPAYTRNFAISKSCGKYLMFCDSDDWYEPNMIEEMVKTIEEQNVDIAMCNADIIDLANGEIQTKSDLAYHKRISVGHKRITPSFTSGINTMLWNKIFKKELIDKYNITYPTKYEHDDQVFIYKYFAVAKTYFGIDRNLYHYYYGNENSIMGQLFTNKNDGREFDFIYAFDDVFRFLKNINNRKYQLKIEENFIFKFNGFTNILSLSKQIEAYKIIRNYLLESKNITNHNKFIRYIRKNDDYICYMLFKANIKPSVNIWREIFSITNFKNHKIIKLLGFKISLKRKNYKDYNPNNEAIGIYIVYHRPSMLFQNDICTPIQAGRDVMLTLNPSNLTEEDKRWMLENTIGDNAGGSISELNEYFSEHTAIYWLWKNYNKIGNPKYIGFMHYRTIFMLCSYPQYKSNYLDICGYNKHCIMGIMKKKKAITGEWVRLKNPPYDWYKDFNYGHNIIFIDELLNIFKTRYKKDYKHFYKWMTTPRNGGPYKNMFIMEKADFFKYCNWIYPILFDLYLKFEKYEYRDNDEKRNIAWISEILTAYYFDRYIREKNCNCMTAVRPIVEEIKMNLN